MAEFEDERAALLQEHSGLCEFIEKSFLLGDTQHLPYDPQQWRALAVLCNEAFDVKLGREFLGSNWRIAMDGEP